MKKFYVTVENGKITGCGECLCLNENAINVDVPEELYNAVITDRETYGESVKYIYSDGEIIENPEYENIVAEREKQAHKQLLLEQIDELDIKRIRAICEPSEKEPGLTWLEFYNSQVSDLREQLKNV